MTEIPSFFQMPLATPVFSNLSLQRMAELINRAETTVIFLAPGLDDLVAGALVAAKNRLGSKNVQVILDVAEENCRVGYGNVDGYAALVDGGVEIRRSSGLRIGFLLSDQDGYLFGMPPMMVESGTTLKGRPNAIRASSDQITAITSAISFRGETSQAPSSGQAEENSRASSTGHPNSSDANIAVDPEIGVEVVPPAEVKRIEQKIEQNPIQDFDLSRIERVFNAHLRLAEFSVIGTDLQKHTVKLPPSLLTAIRDSNTRERITAAFKLVAEKSNVSGDSLREAANSIRRRYFKYHPLYGSVFLKAKEAALRTDIAELEKSIESYRANVISKFEKEAEKSKAQLMAAFWRAVRNAPPEDLASQIAGPKPTMEEAKAYLKAVLDLAFPDPEKLTGEMSVKFTTMDFTWEALNHEGFMDWLAKQYPANLELRKPFQEFFAAREKTKVGITDRG